MDEKFVTWSDKLQPSLTNASYKESAGPQGRRFDWNGSVFDEKGSCVQGLCQWVL